MNALFGSPSGTPVTEKCRPLQQLPSTIEHSHFHGKIRLRGFELSVCLCISSGRCFERLNSQSAARRAVEGENEPLSGARGWSFGGSLNLLDWFAKVCVCIYIYMFIYFKIGSVTFIKFSKEPSIQKRLRASGLNHWKWSIIYLTFPGCFLALNQHTTLLHAIPRHLKRAWGRSSFSSSSFPHPPPLLGPFLCHVFFL